MSPSDTAFETPMAQPSAGLLCELDEPTCLGCSKLFYAQPYNFCHKGDGECYPCGQSRTACHTIPKKFYTEVNELLKLRSSYTQTEKRSRSWDKIDATFKEHQEKYTQSVQSFTAAQGHEVGRSAVRKLTQMQKNMTNLTATEMGEALANVIDQIATGLGLTATDLEPAPVDMPNNAAVGPRVHVPATPPSAGNRRRCDTLGSSGGRGSKRRRMVSVEEQGRNRGRAGETSLEKQGPPGHGDGSPHAYRKGSGDVRDEIED